MQTKHVLSLSHLKNPERVVIQLARTITLKVLLYLIGNGSGPSRYLACTSTFTFSCYRISFRTIRDFFKALNARSFV